MKFSICFDIMVYNKITGHGIGPVKLTVHGDSIREIGNNLHELIAETDKGHLIMSDDNAFVSIYQFATEEKKKEGS